MRRMLLLLALAPGVVQAQTAELARAIRAADWPTAQADAAAEPDPLAVKLVTFYRLQHPDDATAPEIAAFLAQNPDWPNQTILLKRRDEALAAEPDDGVAATLCLATPVVPGPRSGVALARCAAAAAALGQRNDALAAARSAWVAGLPDAQSEAVFLGRWGAALTPADQRAKFDAMLAANVPDAASQAARLAPADERLARARLAVRAGDPAAAALIAALPPPQRATPELVLDQIRALQKADRDDDAVALWSAQGFAAERAAGAPQAAAFWALRSQLARRRLRQSDDQAAFSLADDTLQDTPEAQTDAAFLAGFIALRRLHQPVEAARHFALLKISTAAISQARAHYWLGRAAAAAGDDTAARAEYDAASQWPTTFYGQLACLARGDDAAALSARIAGLKDPAWSSAQALDFAGRELTRAAALLVAWGDPIRARPFLQQVTALSPDPVTRAMAAHLALGLGLPDQAVAAARLAGRQGTLLPDAGWPLAADPPGDAVAPAVSLGVIRQESSFDARAISPSGARGLMQVMPVTARQMGGSPATLTSDPAANMRLGSSYMGQLLAQFDGALPLAAAAYNAGPGRVQQWLAQNGDPRGEGREAMIDWIELIPFAETRNYVQRVIENITVYRAKRNESLAYPVGT